MQKINLKQQDLTLSDDEKVVQEALNVLLAEGFENAEEIEVLVEDSDESEDDISFEEELEGETILIEVLDADGGYEIQNSKALVMSNAAKAGDKKVAKFKISAKSLDYNLTKVSAVSAFINAAFVWARKNALKILARILGGPIAWGLFAWSIISIVFQGVAKKTGHKGLIVSVPMVYKMRVLNHGGKKYKIYQWQPNGKWKVNWY